MNKLIENLKNLYKNVNFQQVFILLIVAFMLSIILISILSPTTLQQVVTPSRVVVQQRPEVTTNPFENRIDPNQIVSGRDNTYFFKNGQIILEDGIATYYYQVEPSPEDIENIRLTLNATSVNLIDEGYKSTNRENPLEPPLTTPFPVFNDPSFQADQSPEGIGEGAVIDEGDE